MINLDSLKRTPELRKVRDSGLKLFLPLGSAGADSGTEAEIIVPIVRVVVVTIGHPRVPEIVVVPGSATHHF